MDNAVAQEWLEIRVSGLECAACARRLALHVRACPGVNHAIANLQTGVLRVQFRPEEISEVNLMVEIRRAGFVPGAEQLRLDVKGMHCRSCDRAIERAVREHCPVERVSARHETGEVLVDYLPGRSNPAAIAAAVEALGYRVESMDTPSPPEPCAPLPNDRDPVPAPVLGMLAGRRGGRP